MRAVSWPQTVVGPRCRPLDVRAGGDPWQTRSARSS
nr:MAG TPA: hypothetical protein [Bacteriophage sp.]DAS31772.1 MAG TPA: hypothetical protein [Caudoviricetes sp.]DAY02382.1 MAG TPA: hypothetical protein [Caudoviricetes sp.]